jgi:DNA-binding transcriptional regulator YiaG
MSDIPITEKLLLNAGGWQAMKPARELLKSGRVSEAKYEPPISRARARCSQGSIRNDKLSSLAAKRDSRIATRQSVGISLAAAAGSHGRRPSSDRANGLVAIRDSRIASCQMSFGTHPRHMRHRKSAGEELSARLRAWREKNDFSQSEAALRLQISKHTLQEWEQKRAKPRRLASVAIEKAIRG